MDKNNRPRAREKKVTGSGNGVHRRGSGLGTGRVGAGVPSQNRPAGSNTKRAAAGGGGAAIIAIIVFFILKFMGGGSSTPNSGNNTVNNGGGNSYTYSDTPSVSQSADTSVAGGSREKRTVINGGGRDNVTLMVYMCGTDLESKYGMASADMEEMRAASGNFGDNFNLIVYTGGCKGWKNNVSSSVNQIYSIKNGKIQCLVSDDGSKSMTDPSTLSSFIRYCSANYPANRSELILWDHGGGSVSGYGYDEKYSRSGSMDLAGISRALSDGGVKFDFIGFDACLMATAETALMLDNYSDYLIASEETEPGIGWYYTDWLKEFSGNTSQSTLEIGKNICDGFVSECGRKCRGQKTTLSLIDLAEFAHTVPSALSDFSESISSKITQNDYKSVSDARYATREFAQESKIDQVDLVNLAENMGTSEGAALSKAIKGAVKYNRTSSNMTNANGVSIYFPYKRTSYVDKACDTYEQIGMDSDYADCIKKFAALETSGQIAAGGTSSPLSSLFGLGGSSGSSGSADVIGQLLSGFLGSGRSIAGLDETNTGFMAAADTDSAADYLSQNYFDPTNLVWEQKDGKYTMTLSDSQWELIHSVDMNLFYFDGEGYVDLGLDNLFSWDDEGNLVADTDKDWVSINGQPVAYYHTDTIVGEDKDVNMGYVPAMLNGDRVNLIIVFEGADGYIAGANYDYADTETDTVAKNLTELQEGDTLDFLCDFYGTDMEYRDSYYLGDQMTVSADMEISNTYLGDGDVRILYRFTDIYNQEYWSEAIAA